MRVLALTWEFPPIITGGLGMACYGMIKSLLHKQVEVDLVMPAAEPLYFPLRHPDDADRLPVASADKVRKFTSGAGISEKDLRELLGEPPSAYYTPARETASYPAEQQVRPTVRKTYPTGSLTGLAEALSSDEPIIRRVRGFAEIAQRIGSKLDFDVIHAHDWLAYPAAMMLKNSLNRPFVAHIHATEFDRAGGPGHGSIHHLEYLGLDYADRVVAVSGYTADTVRDKYCIQREKTTVVHNAYSVPNSPNNHGRIFKEHTILFLGRITLQKGPDYFLEVARRVLQHDRKVRFIMAGTGDMKNRILHRAAAMGLGTKFLVAGFLNREEVDRILSATDIFVLPSVSEPFGIAPLEAMSHGAVAIVSKKAGVAEIIQNAFKIDFWDIDQMVSTIVDLIDNPDELRAMSARSRQEVANLQWDEAADKLINIYEQVMEAQPC